MYLFHKQQLKFYFIAQKQMVLLEKYSFLKVCVVTSDLGNALDQIQNFECTAVNAEQ